MAQGQEREPRQLLRRAMAVGEARVEVLPGAGAEELPALPKQRQTWVTGCCRAWRKLDQQGGGFRQGEEQSKVNSEVLQSGVGAACIKAQPFVVHCKLF